ncbi:MAG: hypothetical protein J5I94_05670 [Phaeodactylibacter sp.]|nr:hypothetical protein [Phaeodactylibacter sp.]
MKITLSLFYMVAILFALTSCKQEESAREKPEEVLKQYQAYIDKNQFEEARALSTPAGQQWLAELEAIISNEQADSTVLDTKFLSLSCGGTGDTLSCACVLEDQYERYTAKYRLVRLDGQWRVDAPEEDIIIENDILESVPDSLLEEGGME